MTTELFGLETTTAAFCPTDDAGLHYCDTGMESGEMELVEHELNSLSEVGVDPLIGYAVFRCQVCGHYWGQYLFKSICSERVNWWRFGPQLTSIHRHIEVE